MNPDNRRSPCRIRANDRFRDILAAELADCTWPHSLGHSTTSCGRRLSYGPSVRHPQARGSVAAPKRNALSCVSFRT
jgi:hypothetical protein